MTVQLDHLIAIVVGALVFGALVVLQQRDATAEVEGVLNHAARGVAGAALDVVGQDAENALTRPQATADGIGFATAVAHDGDRTTAATFTSLVRTSPTAFAPATVRYALEDAGSTVAVGDDDVAVHRLTRTVDGGAPVVVGQNIVDFDVAFVADGAETVDGPAPDRLTQVRVALAVAVASPGQRTVGQRSTRRTHVVRLGTTLRPINLPPTD